MCSERKARIRVTKAKFTVPEILYALRKDFYERGCKLGAIHSYALHTRWEADFLAVTQAGYIHEVEVKLTRSDFRNDFKKARNASYNRFRVSVGMLPQAAPRQDRKHELIAAGQLANYFSFAVPEGLVQPEEVPDYCGLIYISRTENPWHPGAAVMRVERAPKQLHTRKITPELREKLLIGMMYKAFKDVEKHWKAAIRPEVDA